MGGKESGKTCRGGGTKKFPPLPPVSIPALSEQLRKGDRNGGKTRLLLLSGLIIETSMG